MTDLFASEVSFSSVPLEDADVSFLINFPFPMQDRQVFQKLYNETPWQHEEVTVWGKRHLQPRLTAWYGDAGRSYSYSGTVMYPMPWTDLLLSIKHALESLTK